MKNLWKLLSASPCTQSCKGWSPAGKTSLCADWGGLCPAEVWLCSSLPGTSQQRGADTAHPSPPAAREHSLPAWWMKGLNEWTNQWVPSFAFPAALIFTFLLCWRGAGSERTSELGYLEVMCWWHKYTSIPKTLNCTFFPLNILYYVTWSCLRASKWVFNTSAG